MGTVYLGTDGDAVAAVRLIRPGLTGDPAFRLRLETEVETYRRVTGNQVAELIDADLTAEQPWLAFRYVPGPTLAEAIHTHGPLSGDALRGFSVATAEALRQIHVSGTGHWDLRPSDVILTADTPVLTKYGIEDAPETTSQLATGIPVETPVWMSPEQILGEPTGSPADVFAWGAVVAFSATGRNPFGDGRPEALAYRIVHTEADLTDVPDELRSLVSSALSRDSAERPTIEQILVELAGDLDPTVVRNLIEHTWIGNTAGLPKASDEVSGLAAKNRTASIRWVGVAALILTSILLTATVVFLSNRNNDTSASRTDSSQGFEDLLTRKVDPKEPPDSTTSSSSVVVQETAPTTTKVEPQQQVSEVPRPEAEDILLLSTEGLGEAKLGDSTDVVYRKLSPILGEPEVNDRPDCDPHAAIMIWADKGVIATTDIWNGLIEIRVITPGPGHEKANIYTTGGIALSLAFSDVYRKYNMSYGSLVDYGYNDISEDHDFAVESGVDEGITGTYDGRFINSLSIGGAPFCGGMGGM